MRRKLPNLSKSSRFGLLMLIAFVLVICPPRYTEPIKSVAQLVVPFQDRCYLLTQAISDHAEDLQGPEVTQDAYRQVVERARAMENRLLKMDDELQMLRLENARLSGLRRDGAMAGAKLIPARVVSVDPAACYESLRINEGVDRGLRPGAYVATNLLAVHGQGDLPGGGMGVIGAEYLIGRVTTVRSMTAEITLFSDPATVGQEVRIGRIQEDGRLAVVSRPAKDTPGQSEPLSFLLDGQGGGRMRIRNVSNAYIETDPASTHAGVSNPIRVGDRVVSQSDAPNLPGRMVIGEVEATGPHPDNPLIYTVQVRCPVDPARLRWVYIVSMLPPDGGL